MRRSTPFALVILLFASWVPSAWAGCIYDGNAYQRLPDEPKNAYFEGVMDAWSTWQDASDHTWLSLCLTNNLTNKEDQIVRMYQIRLIVENYLAEHPENWHLCASTLALRAISEAPLCAPYKDAE